MRMETVKRTKLPLITTILVAVNVVVFLVSDLFLFDRQEEIAYYMALNSFLVFKGEYWRLLTSMFYHFGMDHLVCNMLMLVVLGLMLEPFFGRIRYLVLYFVSGFVADGASILYNSIIRKESGAFVFSAGASGAVYGLIGAFAAIFLVQRERLSSQEKQRLAFALLFLLLGSIFDTGVGHDAHFGGFLAGIVLGVIYCAGMKKRNEAQGTTRE